MKRTVIYAGLFVVLMAWPAMPIALSEGGSKSAAAGKGDVGFQGKVLWASFKNLPERGMTLIDAEIRSVGASTFLVGTICPMEDIQGPWIGVKTWIKTEEIALLYVFNTVEQARKVYHDATQVRRQHSSVPVYQPPAPPATSEQAWDRTYPPNSRWQPTPQ